MPLDRPGTIEEAIDLLIASVFINIESVDVSNIVELMLDKELAKQDRRAANSQWMQKIVRFREGLNTFG